MIAKWDKQEQQGDRECVEGRGKEMSICCWRLYGWMAGWLAGWLDGWMATSRLFLPQYCNIGELSDVAYAILKYFRLYV